MGERRLLDIIIPHGGEPWRVCRPFFDMLRCQRGADFSAVRVIVVHDGCGPWAEELLEGLPVAVSQRSVWMSRGVSGDRMPAGVSAARNWGLKCSDAEWVSFCDADDLYASAWALHCILDALRRPEAADYDLLWNPFYVETAGGRDICGMNWVFVHGKFYRREWLQREGIQFDRRLYYAEDSAFNATVDAAIDHKRIGEIQSDATLYLWTLRPDSVTGRPENQARNVLGLFDRHEIVAEEYRRRGLEGDADALLAKAAWDGFYQCHRTDLDIRDRQRLRARIGRLCAAHDPEIRRVQGEALETVRQASRREAEKKHMDGVPESLFEAWYTAAVTEYGGGTA